MALTGNASEGEAGRPQDDLDPVAEDTFGGGHLDELCGQGTQNSVDKG